METQTTEMVDKNLFLDPPSSGLVLLFLDLNDKEWSWIDAKPMMKKN